MGGATPQEEDMEAMFEECDQDGDGTLDQEELVNGLRKLGIRAMMAPHSYLV